VNLRQELEQREREILAPYATLSSESRGRLHPEQEHDYRTAFQRDRDRILHSKSFRRLKRKTQVFLAPEGDHYRTRLTHTLEAAQIGRTVARALHLNEDLVEAIALGHDLGHTPFGHAGEFVLNKVYENGFHHAEHGLRVVDLLESRRNEPGLNLTYEVRDGILNHSKGKSILQGLHQQRPETLEASVFSVCDAIAYINHDIDDAIRGGVITVADLPPACVKLLGETTSDRINTMVVALIRGSVAGEIRMEPEVLDATNELRRYMYSKVYPCDTIHREIDKAMKLLREMYEHFLEHPDELPSPVCPDDSVARRAVDFIASMTDEFALQLYARIFFPLKWRGFS